MTVRAICMIDIVNIETAPAAYDRVVAGVNNLQARNYPFHFIGVVTAQTLTRPADLLAHYWSFHPTAIGLNIDELEAQNRHSSMGEDVTTERFEQFIAELLHEAARQDSPFRDHPRFSAHHSSLISGTPEDNDQVVPLRMLNVAHNGDISTFSPELLALDAAERQRFIFGNVHRCDALTDILDDASVFAAAYRGDPPRRRSMRSRMRVLPVLRRRRAGQQVVREGHDGRGRDDFLQAYRKRPG